MNRGVPGRRRGPLSRRSRSLDSASRLRSEWQQLAARRIGRKPSARSRELEPLLPVSCSPFRLGVPLASLLSRLLLSTQRNQRGPSMPRAKKKKPQVEAASRGLDARRLATAAPPVSVMTLGRTIEDDGGSALATYRDPLGGHWQILASLPIDKVEPTPFQRDLSESHVERLAVAIDKLDRFLDP